MKEILFQKKRLLSKMKCLKDRKMDFQGIKKYILRIRLYLEKDNQEFWKKNDSHKKIYIVSV